MWYNVIRIDQKLVEKISSFNCIDCINWNVSANIVCDNKHKLDNMLKQFIYRRILLEQVVSLS